MGTWARPSFGSPSQAGPSEIWGGCRRDSCASLGASQLCGKALSPAQLLSLKPSRLFAIRVYLGRREAPDWDGEGFMGLFSQPPKLPQQPTAPAEGGLEIKSVTRWQDAGMLFSRILPIFKSQLGWTKEERKLPGEEAGAKQCHEAGWEGNMGQGLSHLFQGSCVPSSNLRQL